MTTYLLTWNPKKSSWDDIDDFIDEINKNGYCETRWSCGITKKIELNDRIFLMRQGKIFPGIIGAGVIIRKPYPAKHWNAEAKKELALYVKVRFDSLLNYEKTKIFTIDQLNTGILSKGPWGTRSSGVTISNEIAVKLEYEWAIFLMDIDIVPKSNDISIPEEIIDDTIYYEGNIQRINVNKYERNIKAREKCIEHYGFQCQACFVNFGDFYGKTGIGFIHVHHKVALSQIGANYQLDPINDLIPVCPNCHAMLHRNNSLLTVDKLRKIINKKKTI